MTIDDVDAGAQTMTYWSKVAGANIRRERQNAGMSQADLADRVRALGVTLHKDSLSRLETNTPASGATKPSCWSLDQFMAVCLVLNMPPHKMLGMERFTDMAACEIAKTRWRHNIVG